MNALQRFSDWIADAPGDWPRSCAENSVVAFADTVACMIAGFDDAGTLAATKAVADQSGTVSAVGGAGMFTAPTAALINGTAAHALDFDDVLEGANTHASAVLVPTILALGEERRCSGRACVDAYLIGLEVMAAIGRVMDFSHYGRGWHATSTIGTLAAAAAAARLMRLSAEKTRAAMSISVSMASGSKCQFGTSVKPLHAGMAAMNGLLSARLAEAGLTGSDDCLDGEWGFGALYGGNPHITFSEAVSVLGADTAATMSALRQKPYPCCFSNHQAVSCALELRAKAEFVLDLVDAIEVTLPQVYDANLRYRDPETAREAQFCLEYCVSAALLNGRLGISDFNPALFDSPALRALMKRIKRVPYPETREAGLSVSLKALMRNRANIVVTKASAECLDARGIASKFNLCAADLIGNERAATLYDMISCMPTLADVGMLTRLMVPGSPSAQETIRSQKRAYNQWEMTQ